MDSFDHALQGLGIRVAPGSALEAVALLILELENRRLSISRHDSKEDIRPDWRRVTSLLETVKLFNALYQRSPELTKPFIPHLKLLNEAPEVAQNTRHLLDEASNKLFELFFGLICSPCGTDLVLDHPKPPRPRGDNPDILISIGGRRWGFACKVIQGESPRSWFDLLQKGVEQIQSSEADVGCVVFSLKNLIDHDRLWPIVNNEAYAAGLEEPLFGAWPTLKCPLASLRSSASLCARLFKRSNVAQELRDAFAKKKALPCALLFLPTTVGVQSEVGPLPTILHVFFLMRLGHIKIIDALQFQRLNRALHHLPVSNIFSCLESFIKALT